jgi:chromosome segregation ATPase
VVDSVTISAGAALTALGMAWQFAKVKADYAATMARMEQRVISLEARTKTVETALSEIRTELSQVREGIARLEALMRRTPLPR